MVLFPEQKNSNHSSYPEQEGELFEEEEQVTIHIYEEEVMKTVRAQEELTAWEEDDLMQANAFPEDNDDQVKLRLSELLVEDMNQTTLKDKLDSYPAGTIITTEDVGKEQIETLFYLEEITKTVKDRIIGKSYGDKCDIPFDDLRYIRVLYQGFDGLVHIGELIVNQYISQDIVDIFKELYEIDYPIEQMVLVDEYNADDIASMEANNTSAFNYRVIDRSTSLSQHSYGLAIDINPLYNPYVRTLEGEILVLPESAADYVDRNRECSYYIKEGDPCYKAFIKRGFTWGGAWESMKDYQHFQKKISR
jgi:hypothetical protein